MLPFITIVTKLFFCSLADRYRAHRKFFIFFLTLALIGYGSFAILPKFIDKPNNKDLDVRVWIIICIMFSIATIAMSVVASLSDAFAMNASKKGSISYGWIRVWGTVGWGISSLMLAKINQDPRYPFLVPGLIMLIIFITTDIGLVLIWNKKDFILNKSASEPLSGEQIESNNISVLSGQEQQYQTEYGTTDLPARPSSSGPHSPVGRSKLAKATDFKIQWLLFIEVIKRRRSIVRYMVMFVVSGALMSLQWSFFFKYLKDIFGEEKMSALSGLSMFAQSILGELPFFIISKYFIKFAGRSNTLSISVLTIGIRYILYHYLISRTMFYAVFITEPLAGPNFGLLYVVLTEVGLDYSECEGAVQKVMQRGLVENDPETREKLRQSLRATMQGLMGACYEGLGIGLGNLIGGFIIDHFGFPVLWPSAATIALFFGTLNLVLEGIDFSFLRDRM